MAPELELVLGSLLLSAAVSYCMWVRYRVWLFRQDMFEIRDAMWDEMLASGQKDHPDHRHARQSINALIRFAPKITLFTALYLSYRGNAGPSIMGDNPPPAVKSAVDRVVIRLYRYILRDSLSGIVISFAVLAVASVLSLRDSVAAWFRRVVDKLLVSRDVQGDLGSPHPQT